MQRGLFLLLITMLLPSQAYALCLEAGASDPYREPMAMPPEIGAAAPPVGKPGIEIASKQYVWPSKQPNLWINVKRQSVRVRILDEKGRASQSFKVDDPSSSCLRYNGMYSTYRIVSGRIDSVKGCHCW